MNYYDEEIIIAGPDTKNLSAVKVKKIGGKPGNHMENRSNHLIQQNMLRKQSPDDDGLLQDIANDDDESESDNSDHQKPTTSGQKTIQHSASQRPPSLIRPKSSHFESLPSARVIDNDSESSESGSDGVIDATIAMENFDIKTNAGKAFDFPLQKTRITSTSDEMILKKQTSIDEPHTPQLDITPEKWENLNINQEIKDLFPYILKYTPQHIVIPYRLQPFIPEYVPAVGDVDAFLKVTTPPLLDVQREHELNEHFRKLGLHFLDEPAGEQSQPSLLNMKLRSVLTGSGVNPRLVSAALIPTAKSFKDIDKWITEVEQVHMSQAIHDIQPRKDIEPLLMDWPREYANSASAVQDVYQRCLRQEINLIDYIRALSERFNIEGQLDSQADFILNIQTLFALYLAASQAWE